MAVHNDQVDEIHENCREKMRMKWGRRSVLMVNWCVFVRRMNNSGGSWSSKAGRISGEAYGSEMGMCGVVTSFSSGSSYSGSNAPLVDGTSSFFTPKE
jgi:hypothetical protein